MRCAFLMAVGCIVCLSQAGLADSAVYTAQFSKPDVRYATFQSERNACLGAASHQGWGSGSSSHGTFVVTKRPTYDLMRFSNCMLAKGYKPDPNGLIAAKFWRMSADRFVLASP